MAELEMRLNGGDGNDEDVMRGLRIHQNSQEEADDKEYTAEANGFKEGICRLFFIRLSSLVCLRFLGPPVFFS